jgi:PKD repeat protein
LRAGLAGVCGATLAFGLAVTPAGAVVAEVSTGSGPVTVGMQPRSVAAPIRPASIVSFENPLGAPVMHSSVDYAIYWDPEYGYHGDWEHTVNTFLQGLGQESGSLGVVDAVGEQYTDKTNSRAAYSSVFRGAYSDVKPYPTTGNCKDPDLSVGFPDQEAKKDNVACLTDTQVREQLQAFIAANKLPTGMGTIFFLLTPPGVTVCVEEGESVSAYCSDDAPEASSSGHSFCSYHSFIDSTGAPEGDASTILYATIPWSAGGVGDLHLFDQAPGYECQDGGYDPASTPLVEEPESSPAQQEPGYLAGSRSSDGAFDEGLAELIVNQVSVEQRNVVTNPLLDAWRDSKGNELTDECRNFFAATMGGEVEVAKSGGVGTLFNQVLASGGYYLNTSFNFAALLRRYPAIPCLPAIALAPQFTAPNPVNAGDIVGFDAAESNVTLDGGVGFDAKGAQFETFPSYTWTFGDGTSTISPYPPGAAQVDEPSAFHSYQYGGTYDVTLTVTDVGGNTETTSRAITVHGPPRPAPASPAASGGASASATAPVTGSSAGSVIAAPTVTESVLSKSLKKVARLGLAIHYTVNEQVAGRAEALLNGATAARLGIKGRTATGLPSGYARSIVVGSAVLVTTRAGQGTIRIRFSKTVSAHLAKAGRVQLTLRFVLHNASRTGPQTSTLLSTVVLSH